MGLIIGNADGDITKVIFRRWKDDGSVIAIFPEVPSDIFGYEALSYERVGQHGPCNMAAMVEHSRLVRKLGEKDVAALVSELNDRGYALAVYQRESRKMVEARFAEADRLRKQLEVEAAAHPDPDPDPEA